MSPDGDPHDDAARPVGFRSSLRTRASAALLLVLAVSPTRRRRVLHSLVSQRLQRHPRPGCVRPGAQCRRDYEYDGPAVTRRQAQAQAVFPLRAEGSYPPLALSRDALLAASYPAGLKSSASCATLVFLRTGPDAYEPYGLEGGP